MPYIPFHKREHYKDALQDISEVGIELTGNLNYLITSLCNIYLNESGECYKTYDEIIGAFECAKLEMYRRKVAPYEDQKCQLNGDV
jgi:hypothetical protein